MAERAKHAFGTSENLQNALNSGIIDAYDILFLDGDTDPKVGWVDKNGDIKIVSNDTDLSGIEAELATKANADEVDAKIETAVSDSVDVANAYTDRMVEAAMGEHLTKKYEIANVPEGTLIDYRENEIRIMVPENAQFTKQTVGEGGDPNCYYATFKTYVPNDNAVGYIEQLGDQIDSEIQTKFSTDEYGRRYQSTWLALARYDEATNTWAYYGKGSSKERYIGWDFHINWFDANGVAIASDGIRISLSNERCHSLIEPYYVGSMMKEVDAKIAEMETKIEEVSAYEIIEF